MTVKIKPKLRWELIGGIAALSVTVILLGIVVLWMLSDNTNAPTRPEGTTAAPRPTGPTVIPNPYDNGDFGYKNGYPTLLSGESQLGVDVSSHQGAIDWEAVASTDVTFAMVRIGYRGWGNGEMVADTMAKKNLQGAKKAGLQVGAYFYSQAVNEDEARQEAQFLLDHLGGMALDMPIVFDWEIFSQQGRNAYVDAETVNACARAFCQVVEKAGYRAMIYFNLDMAKNYFDLVALQNAGYPFWLALYGDMTSPYRVDMWQFTQTGTVKGIEGAVDLNLYFTYDDK